MPWLLYSWYLLDRRPGGPQPVWTWWWREKYTFIAFAGNETLIVQPIA